MGHDLLETSADPRIGAQKMGVDTGILQNVEESAGEGWVLEGVVEAKEVAGAFVSCVRLGCLQMVTERS